MTAEQDEAAWVYTLILNLVVAAVLTPVFNAMTAPAADQTAAADSYA